MTPQPGDYACVRVGGETGNLISLGEWLNGDSFTFYDHACIYVGLPDLQAPYGYVMGAQPSGARLDPLTMEQLESSVTGHLSRPDWLWSAGKIPLTELQRGQIVKAALACKGIPYSWADYLALAAHRLHIPVPGLKEYIGDTKSMICSQLVSWAYLQAGIRLFPGEWDGYVTPADLAGILEKHA